MWGCEPEIRERCMNIDPSHPRMTAENPDSTCLCTEHTWSEQVESSRTERRRSGYDGPLLVCIKQQRTSSSLRWIFREWLSRSRAPANFRRTQWLGVFWRSIVFFSFYMFSERKFFLCEQSKREVRLCVHVWLFIFVRLRLACRCSLVSSDGVLLQYYNPLMLATLLEPISTLVHSGDIQEC